MKNAVDYYRDIENRTSDWSSENYDILKATLDIRNRTELDAIPDIRGRVLDIGCQAGHLLAYLKPRFDELYGVDIGDYSAYWDKINGVNFQIHDVDSAGLPFPDAYFNLVTCCNVLEHVFDVFGLVEEISRVLAPQGYVYLEVPNIGYFKHIINLLLGIVPRSGAPDYPFQRSQGWDGQHLHYFTLKDLTWLLKQASLQVTRFNTGGRFTKLRRALPSLLFGTLCMTAIKI
jgi:SAM-dependent methyltransferase